MLAIQRTIPFEFQYPLHVHYSVGRISFDRPVEYRHYAESVVRAETGTDSHSKQIAIFSPHNENNRAIDLAATHLVTPLIDELQASILDSTIQDITGEYATKARLLQLLNAERKPALLFCASLAATFPPGNQEQKAHQGGIVCQDWSGHNTYGSRTLSPDHYVSADDITDESNIYGQIIFAFAPFGAGTPQKSSYYRRQDRLPKTNAAQSFLAQLPQRLLSHPKGGVLAFVGHVDDSLTSSFIHSNENSESGREKFRIFIERMAEGYPVGAALKPFNDRYTSLAAKLAEEFSLVFDEQLQSDLTQDERLNKDSDSNAFFSLRNATADARNWIVLGDPAVRAMIPGLRPKLSQLSRIYEPEREREKGNEWATNEQFDEAKAAYRRALALAPWSGLDPEKEAYIIASRALIQKVQKTG